MKHLFTTLVFIYTVCASLAQTNPLNWEEIPVQGTLNAQGIFRYGSHLTILNEIGSYRSVDSGRTWQLLAVYDGAISDVSSSNQVMVANFTKNIREGDLNRTTIAEHFVWVFSGTHPTGHLVNSVRSDCGWHSGTCYWTSYDQLIGDSLFTWSKSWGGYRQLGGANWYLADPQGGTSGSSEPLYDFIGRVGSDNYYMSGTYLVRNRRDSFALPEPNIPIKKMYYRAGYWFLWRQNEKLWVSSDATAWAEMALPDAQLIDLQQFKDQLIAQTPSGTYQMHIRQLGIWRPVYQNGISLPDTLSRLSFFGDWVFGQENGFLYRSFDGGRTWDKIRPSGFEGRVQVVGRTADSTPVLLMGSNVFIPLDSAGLPHRDSLVRQQPIFPFPEQQSLGDIRLITFRNYPTMEYSLNGGQQWRSNNALPYPFRINNQTGQYYGRAQFFMYKDYLYTVSPETGKLFRTRWRHAFQDCIHAKVESQAIFDCGKPMIFRGDTIRKVGTYSKWSTDAHCDTLFELRFTRNAVRDNFVDTAVKICRGKWFEWKGKEYWIQRDTNFILVDTAGCRTEYFLRPTFLDGVEVEGDSLTINRFNWVYGQRFDRDTIYRHRLTTTNGCDSIVRLKIHIREVAEEGVIQPNPTNGSSILWLDVPTKAVGTLRIFNSFGQVLLQNQIGLEVGLNHIPLDLSSYARGIYMIELFTKQKRHLFKVLKN